MNATDINCTGSFSLLRGPRGDRGPVGAQGIPGATGAKGDLGPKGNVGKSRIDITLRANNNPYITLTSNSYVPVGYIIFSGSLEFGAPSEARIAVQEEAVGSGAFPFVEILIEDVSSTTPVTIGTITSGSLASASGPFPVSIYETNILTNIPTAAAPFRVSARVTNAGTSGTVSAKLFAFELY